MQSTLMHVTWPADVLAVPAFAPELESQGRLVFYGPRMKMGVCTGRPTSIQPDHMGRADYHGASVNQAARCAAAIRPALLLAQGGRLPGPGLGNWHAAAVHHS
jgi:hypothetical protein